MSYPPGPPMDPGLGVPHLIPGSPYMQVPVPGMMPGMPLQMPPSGQMMFQQPNAMPPPLMGGYMQQRQAPQTSATVSAPPLLRNTGIASRNPRAMHMSSSQGGKPGGIPPPDGTTAVTVFVGNITERAPDILVRQLLNTCGPVLAWKRVQGASGKLQAFGFCEFVNQDSGLRAIRLLHDFQLADKKLVVKVDAKTKSVLFKFKGDKKRELTGEQAAKPGTEEEDTPDADYMDEDMKMQDDEVKKKLAHLLLEFKSPMENYQPATAVLRSEPKARRNADFDANDDPNNSKTLLDPPASDLNIGEDQMLDADQKELISREIGKFRETMKQEEAKEKTRHDVRRRDEDRSRDRKKDREREKDKEKGKDKDVKEEDKKGKDKSKSRSPSGEDSQGGFGGSKWASKKISSKGKSRSKTRSKTRSRSRSLERSRSRRKESTRDRRGASREALVDRGRRDRDADRDVERKDSRESRELEDEAREKEKLMRRTQEKEAAFNDRLRKWEFREKNKAADYKKDKEKEKTRKADMQKEAKRLFEFLADYDDEREDSKFYKGRELARRLADRKVEEELDVKDRQKEKEELEELCARIMAEGHADPQAEFQRVKAQREANYKPTILVDVPRRKRVADKENIAEAVEAPPVPVRTKSVPNGDVVDAPPKPQEPEPQQPEPLAPRLPVEQSPVLPASPVPVANLVPRRSSPALGLSLGSVIPPAVKEKAAMPAMTISGRKRVLGVQQAFADDDDDEEEGAEFGRKKRSKRQEKKKTPPVAPIPEPEKTPVAGHDETSMEAMAMESLDDGKRSASGTPAGSTSRKKSGSEEDKRKQIKEIIDRIPSSKAELFNFELDWGMLDDGLMNKRIKPWINKKMVEYIGEEEPTLVDFICQKIVNHTTPKDIMGDVQMVLDEEAETFVVKMWRLLIYEIEAKKLGIGK